MHLLAMEKDALGYIHESGRALLGMERTAKDSSIKISLRQKIE